MQRVTILRLFGLFTTNMEELTLFYRKHSTIILPVVFLVGALFILLQVILPALAMVGTTREELSAQEKKLADYNTSIEVLRQTDAGKLASDVKIATTALPTSKDVQSLYLALTRGAANANVALTGFSVTIGDVYGGTVLKPEVGVTIPSVTVRAQLAGVNLDSLLEFSNALLAISPLSQITKAAISGGNGTVDILFYYKPYDLNKINKDVVNPLTPSQKKILENLPQS